MATLTGECDPILPLDSRFLSQFMERLRSGIPRTISLIGITHHIIQGKLEGKVFTNGWPEFSAIVCQASTSPGLPSVVELTCYAVTNSNFEGVLRIFTRANFLTTEWKVIRLKCDTDLSKYLKTELCKLNPSLQVDTVFNGINYYMPARQPSIIECPSGYVLKSLEDYHAEFVSRYWDWIFEDLDKVVFFKGLIKNFHSIGLFTVDKPDQPIAWCLQYSNGRLAHLFVVEEYRRKGFASLIYQRVCKEILDDGLLPEVVVDELNNVGIDLVEKLGFIRSTDHTGLIVKL